MHADTLFRVFNIHKLVWIRNNNFLKITFNKKKYMFKQHRFYLFIVFFFSKNSEPLSELK